MVRFSFRLKDRRTWETKNCRDFSYFCIHFPSLFSLFLLCLYGESGERNFYVLYMSYTYKIYIKHIDQIHSITNWMFSRVGGKFSYWRSWKICFRYEWVLYPFLVEFMRLKLLAEPKIDSPWTESTGTIMKWPPNINTAGLYFSSSSSFGADTA